MIDQRAAKGRRSVGVVTTAIVAFGAAAAVGWAAAVPIGGSATAGSSTGNGAASGQTSQQLNAAQANLQQVRRDLARLVGREDDLPRATLANLPALPTLQVPQGQPTVIHVTAPTTHTTSGASGARP